jgi:hypothetical protein
MPLSVKGYTEIPAPEIINQGTALPMGVGLRAFAKGELRIMTSQQVFGDVRAGGFLRWHLSISHPSRYPTWDEIRDARYALLPDDVTMAMLLPPQREYVNLHKNCFHLHEIVD